MIPFAVKDDKRCNKCDSPYHDHAVEDCGLCDQCFADFLDIPADAPPKPRSRIPDFIKQSTIDRIKSLIKR